MKAIHRLDKKSHVRKNFVACALAVLANGISIPTYAASDSAVITITGKVLANTCTIDNASKEQNIVLPDISDRDIRGLGKTGGMKDIIITLAECGASVGNVAITTSGAVDSDDSTAFANTASEGAEGVGLYFYQTDGITTFKPDGSVTEERALVPSENNVLTFKAAYVGTKDTVKAGDFNAVVNINFEYL